MSQRGGTKTCGRQSCSKEQAETSVQNPPRIRDGHLQPEITGHLAQSVERTLRRSQFPATESYRYMRNA